MHQPGFNLLHIHHRVQCSWWSVAEGLRNPSQRQFPEGHTETWNHIFHVRDNNTLLSLTSRCGCSRRVLLGLVSFLECDWRS